MGKDIPYVEGFHAGEDGLDPRECPYEKMTAEYREWQRGHALAVEIEMSKE